MPNPVSQMCASRIRRIVSPDDSILFGKPCNLCAPQGEKRPNDLSLGEKCSKASRACIAKNSNEDGLDLIVECVCRCNDAAKLFSLVAQKRPTRDAPLVLGSRGRICSARDEWHIQLTRSPAYKIDGAFCREARCVIEARDQKFRTFRFRECRSGMQHDHRVNAAGDCKKDAVETRERRCGRLFYCVSFMPSVSHGILI